MAKFFRLTVDVPAPDEIHDIPDFHVPEFQEFLSTDKIPFLADLPPGSTVHLEIVEVLR
jgi:hypothetical protein